MLVVAFPLSSSTFSFCWGKGRGAQMLTSKQCHQKFDIYVSHCMRTQLHMRRNYFAKVEGEYWEYIPTIQYFFKKKEENNAWYMINFSAYLLLSFSFTDHTLQDLFRQAWTELSVSNGTQQLSLHWILWSNRIENTTLETPKVTHLNSTTFHASYHDSCHANGRAGFSYH